MAYNKKMGWGVAGSVRCELLQTLKRIDYARRAMEILECRAVGFADIKYLP